MPTNLLDRVRAAIRKPAPTTQQLADALDDARRAQADATVDVEKAAAVVAAGFMDVAAKRQADRDVLAKAREAAEDASLVLAEVERRHVAALAADEETRRRDLYDAAKLEADAAAAAIRKDYPRLARDLVAMLGLLARAQQTVAMVNAELPAGAAPLTDPEFAARGVLGLPREVVSEEEVTVWAYIDSFKPAPDEMQASIKGDVKGWGRHGGSHAPHFRRHRFLKRQVRIEMRGEDPRPLASLIQLPAVLGLGFLWELAAGWASMEPSDVLARVAAIDAAAVARPVKIERTVKVEWEHIAEAEAQDVEEVTPDRTRAPAPLGSRFTASPFAAPGSRPARSA